MNTYTSHLNNLHTVLKGDTSDCGGEYCGGSKGEVQAVCNPLYILPLITIHNGDTLDCGG